MTILILQNQPCSTLYSAGHDGIINAFSVDRLSGELTLAKDEIYRVPSSDAIRSLAVSGRAMAVIGDARLMLKYIALDEEASLEEEDHLAYEGVIGAGDVLAGSPDGQLFAFRYDTFDLRVVCYTQSGGLDSSKTWGAKKEHTGLIVGVAFDPSSSMLVLGQLVFL